MFTKSVDQTSPQSDDPIVASYPIYLTPPNTSSSTTKTATDCLATTGQRLILLQYPAYRSSRTPYNTHNRQKPVALRVKPSTGIVELDVPIDTKHNYDSAQGSAHADALSRSRIAHQGGTHGLSGGFNTGSQIPRNYRGDDGGNEMSSVPSDSRQPDDPVLSTQTLCGKIVKPSAGQPVYMLGSFQNGAMHLSSLDALVQVQPELHHLDAADEIERGSGLSAFNQRGKSSAGQNASLNSDLPSMPPPITSNKPESKPLDIKLKATTNSFSQDKHPNNTSIHNNDLLRAIQQEPWQTYTWIDEADPESRHITQQSLHLHLPTTTPTPNNSTTGTSLSPIPTSIPRLESTLSNSSYLDLLSAPRIEHSKRPGDKGLMWKVRGREREKQRRKRNEAVRRERRAAEAAAAVTTAAAAASTSTSTSTSAPGPAAARAGGDMGGAGSGSTARSNLRSEGGAKGDEVEVEGTDDDEGSDDDSSDDGHE